MFAVWADVMARGEKGHTLISLTTGMAGSVGLVAPLCGGPRYLTDGDTLGTSNHLVRDDVCALNSYVLSLSHVFCIYGAQMVLFQCCFALRPH
jgi:hypothetical protein